MSIPPFNASISAEPLCINGDHCLIDSISSLDGISFQCLLAMPSLILPMALILELAWAWLSSSHVARHRFWTSSRRRRAGRYCCSTSASSLLVFHEMFSAIFAIYAAVFEPSKAAAVSAVSRYMALIFSFISVSARLMAIRFTDFAGRIDDSCRFLSSQLNSPNFYAFLAAAGVAHSAGHKSSLIISLLIVDFLWVALLSDDFTIIDNAARPL